MLTTGPEEVANILETCNLNKVNGSNSILVKISIKDLKSEVSNPLFTLIKLSFNTGISADSIKLARVIPEFLLGQVLEI